MSERNHVKERFFDREKNTDALFGVLHIKDRPYLHQRTAQHMFGESDSAVVVPVGTVMNISDDYAGNTARGIKITLAVLTAIGIAAFMVYLFHLDPGFLIPFA